MPPALTPDLDATFHAYPPEARAGLLLLRQLIFEEANTLPQIGPLAEVLRWGQPSYITPKRRAATPLRLGTHKSASFALFAHCQSGVISTYAMRFPGWDRLDGNRAVLFDSITDIEPFRLATLIRHALTYHLKQPEQAAH
ncbi:DUF1801 domain-containing protein [Cognatishimia sp. SS12]|uniref:DUF1801 domain-containing protein n=1 Tax=Cognatishimia sp. SS12 TaxID=2979465 RepID=UPI00232B3F38|nr:DUF1801 domain-containing protein [Cognatishimia sp. SS12]MDC0737620.1 DUF1801 domain-containing protein [Cognatishimia sp. SS12]